MVHRLQKQVFIAASIVAVASVTSFAPVATNRNEQPLIYQRHLNSIPQSRQLFPRNFKRLASVKNEGGSNQGPDPAILISAKSGTTQRLAFISAFALLATGTTICIELWKGPGIALCANVGGYEWIRGTAFPIVFGAIFSLVGVLHFIFVENFARIVPPKGTWGGLWQAPAPFQQELGVTYEEYHSYWTGIAEVVGGLWLLMGGLGWTDVTPPAFLLFLLTIGVTPANLYMFTHDANPGGAIPRLQYPFGHVARFTLQCGLLSNFWIMANP